MKKKKRGTRIIYTLNSIYPEGQQYFETMFNSLKYISLLSLTP
ncbi:hypothetical protein [Chitinophaga sp. OAE865]